MPSSARPSEFHPRVYATMPTLQPVAPRLRKVELVDQLLVRTDRLLEVLLDGLRRLRLRLQVREALLVELHALHLALLLQAGQDRMRLPAELLRQVTEAAELAVRLEAQGLQRSRHHHALLLVVRVGDAVERLQAVHRHRTAGRLVRDHATDSAEEDLLGARKWK